MNTGIYLAVILIVAGVSAISGFRKGITRQITSVLGLAFGAVAARLFTPGFSDSFKGMAQTLTHGNFAGFTSNLLCAICIYLFVYALFSIFTGVLKGAVSIFNIGILNRLAGSFFCILKNLTWVSMLYLLILCIIPGNRLIEYARTDDGNMVCAVMKIAPALTGCYGPQDFAHLVQLKEASKISCNFNTDPYVIEKEGMNAELLSESKAEAFENKDIKQIENHNRYA